MLKALLYAYVLGGITFIPLVIAACIFFTIYTSVPVGDADVAKPTRTTLESQSTEPEKAQVDAETNDVPRNRKGWLTMRRTFEESTLDGGYVTLVRSFLDSRSKDPKRSRPKDMWYVVLKGKVLFLYEDEEMSECGAVLELSSHEIIIYPEGLQDGELFAKRNAICLRPKVPSTEVPLPNVTKDMKLEKDEADSTSINKDASEKSRPLRERRKSFDPKKKESQEEPLDPFTPWFMFVRSNFEMEDWYLALIHASEQPSQTPTLAPLASIFEPADMNHLVATLDEQPDIIPMRWLNALLGRIFFSFYRTQYLESYIIGRLMKKLSKVKRPNFLTDIVVTEVSVGNNAPMFSKPMLKELTREGDASLEVHMQYKGEIRITVEATATINLGSFKSYTVKLVLAAVLKELEGNLLIKVKRPPSNRIWYAFTQTPRMVLVVEPIVSDRQITWGMILSTIESKFKEIIQESVVMPNMDDIAFFESKEFMHRGGIWSDASRQRKPSPPQLLRDDISTVSAPVIDVVDSAGTIDVDTLPERSHSVDPAALHIPSSSPPDNGTLATAMSQQREGSSTPPQNHSGRRNWFSSVRSDELGFLASLDTPKFKSSSSRRSSATEKDRGRSNETKFSTIRSLSSSNESASMSSTSTLEEGGNDYQSNTTHSLQNENPSTSRQSIKSDEDTPTASSSQRSRGLFSAPSTPKKSQESSEAPKTNSRRSASPPGFFSTLKSRDKQAISNTAKETMRKWGVNWGGLKKDSNNAVLSTDTLPENGSLSQLQSEAQSHNKRASYAEVRAAVAERKEREKNSLTDDGSSRAPSPNEGSQPKTSSESAAPHTGEAPSKIVTTSSKSPSLKSRKSVPSLPKDVDIETAIDEQQQVPVRVQPQAKTMSIPGIHASHRGEVMSMGYVAPQPAPVSTDAKLKNPAMQSVYRLWKNQNPALSDADQESGHAQLNFPSQDVEKRESIEITKADSPAQLDNAASHSPASQSLVNTIPPPLPPRSTPVAIARSPPLTHENPNDGLLPVTASGVLQSIATRDESTRKRFSSDNSSPSQPGGLQPEEGSDHMNYSATESTVTADVPPVQHTEPTKKPAPPLPPRQIQASA